MNKEAILAKAVFVCLPFVGCIKQSTIIVWTIRRGWLHHGCESRKRSHLLSTNIAALPSANVDKSSLPFLFPSLKMGRSFVFGCVFAFLFCFLFSTPLHVPKILMGLG